MNTCELRKKVWNHIFTTSREKDIFIDFVNGYQDHCHCLVSLGAKQSMSEIMRLVKGESSHWINKELLTETKFQWQEEYYAVSVSKTHVDRVRQYIQNQEEHHQTVTFDQELEHLKTRYNFQKYS